MATDDMHEPITLAMDGPAFANANILHAVNREPGFGPYDRPGMNRRNAIMIEMTFPDGRTLTVWPSGTIQVCDPAGTTGVNYRVTGLHITPFQEVESTSERF